MNCEYCSEQLPPTLRSGNAGGQERDPVVRYGTGVHAARHRRPSIRLAQERFPWSPRFVLYTSFTSHFLLQGSTTNTSSVARSSKLGEALFIKSVPGALDVRFTRDVRHSAKHKGNSVNWSQLKLTYWSLALAFPLCCNTITRITRYI
jgi:hypothetical protein